MTRSVQEALIRVRAVRWAMGVVFFLRGHLHLRRGRLYRGLDCLCWVVRVARTPGLDASARRTIFGYVARFRDGRNTLVDSYLADPASDACASLFTLTGRGPHDLFRDLIVLKRATPDEKGVILLKYVRTFDAVIALFHLERLMERYTFVLEPCWAGYMDPSLLMFIARNHPVFVQCFTEEDYALVRSIGSPLVPLRLGPADWVDADLFAPEPDAVKAYDLVMVANWAPHKRHSVLFQALKDIRDRDIRVLLIGFPWSGRTADDIRREAAAIRNPRVQVEVLESVPAQDVARYVSRCKALVFLSRKEGDNKALVEAMFADVPAIVYDETIGGAKGRINPSTGVLTPEADLPGAIRHMLDHYRDFAPRAWVIEHSGSAVATRVLDDAIASVMRETGGAYSGGLAEKTNAPNLAYKDPAIRLRFHADYEFILSCRRHAARESAVA